MFGPGVCNHCPSHAELNHLLGALLPTLPSSYPRSEEHVTSISHQNLEEKNYLVGDLGTRLGKNVLKAKDVE